jgi:hypothetical protein
VAVITLSKKSIFNLRVDAVEPLLSASRPRSDNQNGRPARRSSKAAIADDENGDRE